MSDVDRQREAEASARRLAKLIDESIPEGWLFTLNLYDTKSDRATYISNARPDDVPAALRECADKIEKRESKGAPRGM
jgi:hypothetical protein